MGEVWRTRGGWRAHDKDGLSRVAGSWVPSVSDELAIKLPSHEVQYLNTSTPNSVHPDGLGRIAFIGIISFLNFHFTRSKVYLGLVVQPHSYTHHYLTLMKLMLYTVNLLALCVLSPGIQIWGPCSSMPRLAVALAGRTGRQHRPLLASLPQPQTSALLYPLSFPQDTTRS
jgi:hypothetical protein